MRSRLVAIVSALVLASTALAADRVFDLSISHGKLSGGPDTIRVHQGDTVVLRWHSDRSIVLHLHGYEIETRVEPGAVAEIRLDASATGRFPVHVHGSGARSEAVLVYLEVYPD
jgi:hypothetical protein